jgi:type II secretory pathway pseudopilin PulG
MPRTPQTPPACRVARPRGFTIVELLAVIGTITVLLGLLLAGLQAARRSSAKTVELTHLRQLHLAWTAYSGSNNDYVLPGHLDAATQQQWRLRYRLESGGQVPAAIASFYPWRLLPYLDWGYETLVGYLPNTDFVEEIPKSSLDPAGAVIARQVNAQPWFGYNAYYVGGWWEASNGGAAQMLYSNSLWMQSSSGNQPVPTRGNLVVRTVGRATNPASLVLFAGSTVRAPGLFSETSDGLPGAAWCSPHRRGELPVWNVYLNIVDGLPAGGLGASLLGRTSSVFAAPPATLAQGGEVTLEVLAEDAVPYRRQSATVSVVHLDGNATGAGVSELLDQRRWINAANDAQGNPRDFRHTDN